ncbi:hypothetical protein HDV01_006503 [Terramyces sp. JEL0728]|nr:hypothetical protein HDV01_006503 [Terramyces sp. JEL0728]
MSISTKNPRPTTAPQPTTTNPPITTPNPPTTTQNPPLSTDIPPPVTATEHPNNPITSGQITLTNSANSPSQSNSGSSDNTGSASGKPNDNSGGGMSTNLIIALAVCLGAVFIGIVSFACWKSNAKSALKTITPLKRSSEPSPTVKPFDHEARPVPYYNRPSPKQEYNQTTRETTKAVYTQQYATYETNDDSYEYYDQQYYGYQNDPNKIYQNDPNKVYQNDPNKVYQNDPSEVYQANVYQNQPREIQETLERGEIPIMQAKKSSLEEIQPPIINQQKRDEGTIHSIDKGTLQPPLLSPE